MSKNKERDSSYYNLAYNTSKAYSKMPEDIKEYYPMWLAAAMDVSNLNPEYIVDLGCGAGHFAEILRRKCDSGEMKLLTKYIGHDFSSTAISMARKMVDHNKFSFIISDLYKTKFYLNNKNTVYTSYEFLEHVDGDLDIIKNIPKGSYFSFSVPSFDSKGHVRFFKNKNEVFKRYSKYINITKCSEFVKEQPGTPSGQLIIYLCLGTVK